MTKTPSGFGAQNLGITGVWIQRRMYIITLKVGIFLNIGALAAFSHLDFFSFLFSEEEEAKSCSSHSI
jgi:hypothetical protein